MTTRATVLIAAPDAETRSAALADAFDVITATDASAARQAMADQDVACALVAHPLGPESGVDLLAHMAEAWPDTQRIALADRLPEGGADAPPLFQTLPALAGAAQVKQAARAACQMFHMTRENARLTLEARLMARGGPARGQPPTPRLRDGAGFEHVMYAEGSPMLRVVAMARQYASFDLPVLITGAPGTGKAQIARAMHGASLRSDKPFHQFDCRGLTDTLIEAELFGARKGALDGSPQARTGLLQKADHGTLFLNGIDTLGQEMQLRLLRVATEGQYQPLGAAETLPTGVRLLTGAQTDLRARVAAGTFRADLFYAIAVAELPLPPLQARRADLPLLAQEVLFAAARRHGKHVTGLTQEAMDFLCAYDWPGNLPELENEITRMLVFAQDPVLGADLMSRHILQAAPRAGLPCEGEALMSADGPLKDRVEAMEACILRETLTRLRWNKSRAAAELGLSRVGLRAKLDRYQIAPPETVPDREEA